MVAAGIAVNMQADKLVLLTDVPGLLRNPDDPDSLISVLKVSDVPKLTEEGVIAGDDSQSALLRKAVTEE